MPVKGAWARAFPLAGFRSEGNPSTWDVQLETHRKRVKRRDVKRVDAPKSVTLATFGRLSKCWFLPCKFGDQELEVLIDTGTENCVMSINAYSRLSNDTHTDLEKSGMTLYRHWRPTRELWYRWLLLMGRGKEASYDYECHLFEVTSMP